MWSPGFYCSEILIYLIGALQGDSNMLQRLRTIAVKQFLNLGTINILGLIILCCEELLCVLLHV